MKLLWLQIVIQLTCPWLIWSYEFYHMKSMKVFKPPETLQNDSYFGYSVTYVAPRKRLIISAPRASTVGKIYSCDIDQKTDCKTVTTTPELSRDYPQYDHDYWLGATVAGGKINYVTCAPRQVRRSEGYGVPGEYATCYKSTENNDTLASLSTLTKKNREPFDRLEEEMDSFGWSITVSDAGAVLIGGPALNHGQVMRYNNMNAVPSPIRMNNTYNFGYSVAIIHLQRSQFYAVGSTYGTHGEGSVTLYRKTGSGVRDPIMLKKGKDEHMVGTMYGAVLCAAKLSVNALLVGAPAYALQSEYDVGAVYVYSQGFKGLTLKRFMKGYKKGSFFGSAIISVGDLNEDGIDEIAIAAPYEDDTGVVYLYCGARIQSNKDTITELQKIEPKIFKTISTFGLSLSAVRDYDENGCNELAIGAPGADRVAVLQCMATVTVELRAEFPNLQKRSSAVPSSSPFFMNETYATFKSCMDVVYPPKPKTIVAKINVEVKLTHVSAKLADAQNNVTHSYIVSLDTKEKEYCHLVGIVLPKGGHYDMKINYHITATLLDNPVDDEKFNPSKVIFNERSKTSTSGSVFATECKNESACEPKLNLTVNFGNFTKSKYLIGSTPVMPISITIKNEGEPAYSSCVTLHTKGVPIRSLPVSNCARQPGGVDLIQCEPPIALKKGKDWNTKNIELDTSQMTNMDKKFEIFIQLYDYCGSRKTLPKFIKVIELETESAGITVTGSTQNYANDFVNVTRNELSTSKQIEHKYTFINNGITNWKNVSCKVKLIKSPYIKMSSFHVQDGDCEHFIDTEKYWQSDCTINKIYKQKSNNLHIFIELESSDQLVQLLSKENLTIQSDIALNVGERVIKESITSTIMLEVRDVPLWVIVCAIIVGLLILLLIAMILREVGLLKRQKRKKLEELRRSVRRQTIRRSMAVQERQRIVSQACEAVEDDSNCDSLDKPITSDPSHQLEHKIMEEIRIKNMNKK